MDIPESPSQVGRPNPRDLPPDQMPQIYRELTMLKGAVASVHGGLNDLLSKLHDVSRDEPESPNVETGSLRALESKLPLSAPMAREMSEISAELSAIEDKLVRAYHRLEL